MGDPASRVVWLLVEDTAFGSLKTFTASIDEEDDRLKHLGRPALSAEEGINRTKCDRPHVVLLDLKIPERMSDPLSAPHREHGTRCAVEIRQQCLHPQVLVFSNDLPDETSHEDRDRIKRLDQAGVIGYIWKRATYGEVAEAILTAARNEPVFKPGAAYKQWRLCIQPEPHPCFDRADPLTDREHEAMVLLAQFGLGDKDIGRKMIPSVKQDRVSQLLSSSCAKLGLSGEGRGALIVWARAHCPQTRRITL
jgi:DNA-binding NarL/FixJ family response regulator